MNLAVVFSHAPQPAQRAARTGHCPECWGNGVPIDAEGLLKPHNVHIRSGGKTVPGNTPCAGTGHNPTTD